MGGKQKTISIQPDPAAARVVAAQVAMTERDAVNHRRKPPAFEKGTALCGVLQWSEADAVSMIRTLEWMADLRRAECVPGQLPMLAHCCPRRTPVYLVERVEHLIAQVGSFQCRIQVPFDLPDESYPRGSVWGLWNIARWAKEVGWDFLLMEPDMIPLKPGWWGSLCLEYQECPWPYLGAHEPAHPAGHYPAHQAGCGVYHHRLWDHLQCDRLDLAWDVAIAEHVLPLSQQSTAIQQVFGSGSGPVFRSSWDVRRIIREDAVLFHRNKDGSLIRILSERLARPVTEAVPVIESLPDQELPLPPRRKVFTYFEKLDEHADDHLKMIEIWKRSWAAMGWDPVVLGDSTAMQHLAFGLLENYNPLRATKNRWEYERACYRRWLAYDWMLTMEMRELSAKRDPAKPHIEIGDPCLVFSDWDVMNQSMPAAGIGVSMLSLEIWDCSGVPCAGRVNLNGLKQIVDAFLTFRMIKSDHHCRSDNISDMNIIRDRVWIYSFYRGDEVSLYGQPSKRLIHFSNSALPDPRRRMEAVARWDVEHLQQQEEATPCR